MGEACVSTSSGLSSQKGLVERGACSALSGGIQRAKPNGDCRGPAASGGRRRRANNYDLIFCEVKYFMTKLCRVNLRHNFSQGNRSATKARSEPTAASGRVKGL